MTDAFRLDRAFIRVGGAEAAPFLDNLLTQNVGGLTHAGVLYAGLLSPQGKVIADMLLWDDDRSILIETDVSHGPELLRRLAMYRLRAPITLDDLTGERMALWSPAPFAGARPDPRRPEGALGWRAITAKADGLAPGGPAYDLARLAAGVPDLAGDAAAEEVFALEALFEELNGVDFAKGCFVGQENVSRMKRRATTRKKFCPVVFTGDAPPFGAPVMAAAAEIGTIRSGCAGRALALLRLDRALQAKTEGVPLTAGGLDVALAPPPWLRLPASD